MNLICGHDLTKITERILNLWTLGCKDTCIYTIHFRHVSLSSVRMFTQLLTINDHNKLCVSLLKKQSRICQILSILS